MIDLPLLEQFDRLLLAVLLGLLLVPLWLLATRVGRRRGLWRGALEALLLLLLSVGTALALFLGTLGDLRGYAFLGLALGGVLAAGLLGVLRVPWEEYRGRRRT